MTLSSWLKLVKSELAVAATATLLTAIALALVWRGDAAWQQQTLLVGDSLAASLAQSSVDALLERNQLHLGVLANRLTEIDGVSGAAIYTVEDEVLAMSGKLVEGRRFSHPVTLDDAVIGFARVTLEPSMHAPAPDWGRRLASLLLIGVIPLMVAAFAHIRRAQQEPVIEVVEPPPRRATLHYLLVANLHNQLSLSQATSQAVMDECLTLGLQVGEIYQADCRLVPGKGLLMDFRPGESQDRPFQVVCAAFLLASCLDSEVPDGEYRIGLHALELFADEDPADHEAVLEDTKLLAALGKPNTLVVSESFFADIERPERVTAELLRHAMLDELTTTGRQCCLITELKSPHRALIESQAERLVGALRH